MEMVYLHNLHVHIYVHVHVHVFFFSYDLHIIARKDRRYGHGQRRNRQMRNEDAIHTYREEYGEIKQHTLIKVYIIREFSLHI